MLRIPRLRQPNDSTCLPTCVCAVLRYFGRGTPLDEAVDMCRCDPTGAVAELAVEGLVDAGIDAELRQFSDLDDLVEPLAQGQPVIALLRHPSGPAHCVVVCEVTGDQVTVMDPASGGYTTLSRSDFALMWEPLETMGVTVGTRKPRRRR